MASIDELKVLAETFGDKLALLKRDHSPGPFKWYPYQSLSNFETLNRTLTGESRALLDLASGKRILDIGCADGDIAFFFESLGYQVDVIDNPITNFNAMCGVRALKSVLGSSIEIQVADLDGDFMLPYGEYGLVLLLGVLYHLKNPFLVLEKLSKHTSYCLLSTALTSVVPGVGADVSKSPISFLASEREMNDDPTVYWIFTDVGFRRLLDRTNWEICDYQVFPTGDRWTGQRVFCLLKSRFADRPVNILYGRGWHDFEDGEWRWTEKRFAIRIVGSRKTDGSQLRLGLYIPDVAGTITIEAIANGISLAPETYSGPGEYEFVRSLAPFGAADEDIRIDFNLSSALPPDSTDLRERGIIVASIAVE
jgi:tRNA (mo5U34)-methyltransferase